jgi:HSP20 family molecular chaperone IbpA
MIIQTHPLSGHFLFGKPHIYLFKPLYHEPKPSTETEEDKSAKTSDPDKSDQQAVSTTATKESTPVIYQDRGVIIEDHGDYYSMSLDVPGVKSSDVKVEIREGILSIEAQRKSGDKVVAKYAQHFVVNDYLDESKMKANLSDGVLSLTIPKKEEAKPHAIPVLAEYPPEEKNEDATEVRMSLDVPGVCIKDVKLQFSDGKILLHAERTRGRVTGTIEKEFYADAARIDPMSFKGYLMDGVLTIVGSRKANSEPKSITISTEPLKIEDTEMKDNVVVETVADNE